MYPRPATYFQKALTLQLTAVLFSRFFRICLQLFHSNMNFVGPVFSLNSMRFSRRLDLSFRYRWFDDPNTANQLLSGKKIPRPQRASKAPIVSLAFCSFVLGPGTQITLPIAHEAHMTTETTPAKMFCWFFCWHHDRRQ